MFVMANVRLPLAAECMFHETDAWVCCNVSEAVHAVVSLHLWVMLITRTQASTAGSSEMSGMLQLYLVQVNIIVHQLQYRSLTHQW